MTAKNQTMDASPAREPGERIRNVLRWLYLPWVWLVFIPFLAVTTIFWGSAAVAVSVVSKRWSFHCGTIWAWCLCLVNFTFVRVTGRKHAQKGQSYVIMSNHQSHFDILVFYGNWGRQFRWVMKQELRKTPGLGWGCAAVGHIFIDRSDRAKAIASLNAAKPLLQGGVSVMFFPEGTRSRNGRLGEFKKGGFVLAMDMGLPILPVSISGSRHVLPGKTFKLLPGRVQVRIHEPIEVSRYPAEQRARLMEDVAATIASGLSQWEQRPSPVSDAASRNDSAS